MSFSERGGFSAGTGRHGESIAQRSQRSDLWFWVKRCFGELGGFCVRNGRKEIGALELAGARKVASLGD
jgi:hypothetical protein